MENFFGCIAKDTVNWGPKKSNGQEREISGLMKTDSNGNRLALSDKIGLALSQRER